MRRDIIHVFDEFELQTIFVIDGCDANLNVEVIFVSEHPNNNMNAIDGSNDWCYPPHEQQIRFIGIVITNLKTFKKALDGA